MSIFNRRNAVVGWLSWLVAKRVLKKKARDVVPGGAEEPKKRLGKAAIVGALAALGGVVWFWRRSSADDTHDELPPPAGE